MGRTDFDYSFASEGYTMEDIVNQLQTSRSELSIKSKEVIDFQYESDIVFNKFLSAVERVKNKNPTLKINLVTLLVDVVVHRELFKNIYRNLLSNYIRNKRV